MFVSDFTFYKQNHELWYLSNIKLQYIFVIKYIDWFLNFQFIHNSFLLSFSFCLLFFLFSSANNRTIFSPRHIWNYGYNHFYIHILNIMYKYVKFCQTIGALSKSQRSQSECLFGGGLHLRGSQICYYCTTYICERIGRSCHSFSD